jgi:hypothetical protein
MPSQIFLATVILQRIQCPIMLPHGNLSECMIPDADDRLNEMKKAQEEAKSTLEIANEHMKHFYDHRINNAPEFKPGDKVWLDAKNVKQCRPSAKLSNRRLGPFEVLEKVGIVDYKLRLLDQYKIHLVFHVSLLTEYQPSHLIQHPPFECTPPEIMESNAEELIVQEVLDSRR